MFFNLFRTVKNYHDVLAFDMSSVKVG
uniref:Uncharacterized protein n=1 Tax=Rhizophora mucronata TaxID=61149 RepID=A0A2P2PBC5_RHIMU